jgi:hypothetical protein
MVAGVMVGWPGGVAVERVLPQRVPRRQIQLQVAAVGHNLQATSGASGMGHLFAAGGVSWCVRRFLVAVQVMQLPLYDGVLLLQAASRLRSVHGWHPGTPLYKLTWVTSPVQLVLFFLLFAAVTQPAWNLTVYEELLFNFIGYY